MSEMLGNQYFLSRKYCEAIRELEDSLIKDPSNKSIKKKLIVCNVKTGRVKTALELFEQLIIEDAYFIINTDPILDDCPCPEIIYEIENSSVYVEEKEKEISLGILWLYCDIKHSIKHFTLLSLNDRRFELIVKILKANKQYIKR